MFQLSEKNHEEFHTLGYTIFRGVVPPSLIGDLRRECEKGAALARADGNPNAQRFQPISRYAVNQQPFQDYTDLPEIRDALAQLLSPHHQPAGLDLLGVLVEPSGSPYCMPWHRDWRDNIEGVDMDSWHARYQDMDFFNQVNCALYEDSCTWVVPGSHSRLDTDEEVARFPTRPFKAPSLVGVTDEECERICLEYCESMPNAQRLLLDAGDYCLYRSTMWHLGNYIPYRKRATLHDAPMTPAFDQWRLAQFKTAAANKAAGATWQNPNEHRLSASKALATS